MRGCQINNIALIFIISMPAQFALALTVAVSTTLASAQSASLQSDSSKAAALIMRADSLMEASQKPKAERTLADTALRLYSVARQVDPANVNAYIRPVNYLLFRNQADEAYPIALKAAQMFRSPYVHLGYWRAAWARSGLSIDEKRSEIYRDLEALIAAAPNDSSVWGVARTGYQIVEDTARFRAMNDTILARWPASHEAEWVLAEQWRSVSEDTIMDRAQRTEKLRKTWRDFIARPVVHSSVLRAEAAMNLVLSYGADTSGSAVDLLALTDTVVKYSTANHHITYSALPIIIAEHKGSFRDAERIARMGPKVMRPILEQQRAFYDSEGDYVRAVEKYQARMHDALGWIYYNEGRHAEALKELNEAYRLNPQEIMQLWRLARVYETVGQADSAEKYFIKGALISSPGNNPNRDALKRVYMARNGGSLEGYEKYLGGLKELDSANRRKAILGSRTASPKAALAFNLKTLDGKRVSLSDLQGKIVVVNFWGIWCGWCVKELPDYQKVHDKYKSAPDVVILTIDTQDPSEDVVRAWVKKKGYTFPVLYDDGFVSKTGIRAFPTTWFIDTAGRLAYEKSGWSEYLEEEFGWRIESLQQGISYHNRKLANHACLLSIDDAYKVALMALTYERQVPD